MGGVSLDIAAALALVRADGVSAAVAGPLLAAAAEGLLMGVSDRRGEDA